MKSINTSICSAVYGSFLFFGMMQNINASDKNELPWKKPSRSELEKKLSPTQCQVTQDGATEQPFKNEYWDNKKPGIYVDIVSGEPLFSSIDKYDSGTGWPSFSKTLTATNVKQKLDRSHGMERIEVRSTKADSHLGHLFDDEKSTTGQRYCINSASLKFIPVERLEKEGYGQFKKLFEPSNTKSSDTKKLFDYPLDDFAGNIPPGKAIAVFAGGCFWGMEEIIRSIKGVVETQVGYTGGSNKNPTYKDVSSGKTGHAESVQIIFDPKIISYEELLGWFFRMHDPTTQNRQGNDRGTQYRSHIFVYDETQRKSAELVMARVDKSGKWKKPIVTKISKAGPFWRAEIYHQKYLQKNPTGYTCHYLRD